MADMTPNPSGLYIKEITLPTGSTYEIVDQAAREIITNLSSYTDFLGVTNDTNIYDGATVTSVVIGSTTIPALVGNIVIKPTNSATAGMIAEEYIYGGENVGWQLFGSISADNLGDLAYKDSASGSYVKFVSVNSGSSTVTSSGSFTPTGSVTFNGTEGTVSVTGTFVNTASLTTTSTYLKITSTTVAPATENQGNYWNYTPEGTVEVTASATGNSTTKAYVEITGRNVIASITTAASTSNTVVGGLNYTSVENHTLKLGYIVSTSANAISASTSADVVNNMGSITASGTFSGTAIWAQQFTVDLPNGISLGTGTITASGAFTPSGTAAFSGTAGTVSVTSTAQFINSVTSTTSSDTITVS